LCVAKSIKWLQESEVRLKSGWEGYVGYNEAPQKGSLFVSKN